MRQSSALLSSDVNARSCCKNDELTIREFVRFEGFANLRLLVPCWLMFCSSNESLCEQTFLDHYLEALSLPATHNAPKPPIPTARRRGTSALR